MPAYGISPYTLNFIKSFEGYTPQPKWDYKQYSVGYGTRWNPGDPVGTQAQHEAALANEVQGISDWLGQNVKLPMTPQQRAALIDAGYNLGTGKGGLTDFLPDINSGNWSAVAQKLQSYNHAGGKVNAGLTDRRAQEAALLTGDSSMLTSPLATATFGAPNPNQPQSTQRPMITQGPDPIQQKLIQAMAMRQLNALPQSRSWQQAVGNALPLYAAMFKENQLREQQKAHQKSLSDVLLGANDANTISNALISSGDPNLVKAGVSTKLAASAPKVGRFKIDSTTGAVYDSVTGQIVSGQGAVGTVSQGTASGNPSTAPALSNPIAEKERQKAVGKAVGEAQANLPTALENGRYMIQTIDQALADPNLESVTGSWQGKLPSVIGAPYAWATGGTARAQGLLDQIQGQTFLQAFDSLRGGGQITEAEGSKATAALNRLHQQGMSDKDYRTALMDFRNEVSKLYDIIQQRANISENQRQKLPSLANQPNANTNQNAAPTVGTIEQGYRFKGGDPANKANWELVQ